MKREAAGTDSYALACEVGAALTSSLVLEDVLGAVARLIAEAVGVWECDLYEYYPESRTIVAAAAWARELSAADLEWVGTVASLEERPSYMPVLLDGETVESYADVEASADAADRALMDQWGELATLSVPLVFEGEVIGCLTLVEKRDTRHFDDDDKELVSLLAIPAAAAIHNARMYRWEEQQDRHLSSLLDSTRALTSAVTPEDVLMLVCREAAAALDATDCVIYEYDAGADAIVYRALHTAAEGGDDPQGLGTVYALDEYPSDREVLRSGQVAQQSISDAELAPDVRSTMTAWGEKSCLSVPLTFGGEPLGLLDIIETRRDRRFSEEEVELARGLGEQAAVALRHAQLYRRQEDHNRRLLALLETSRVLAASLDAGEVLAEMRSEAAGLFGVTQDAVAVCVRAGGGYLPLERALASEGDDAADGGAEALEAPELDDLQRRALGVRRPAQKTSRTDARLVVPLLINDEAEGFVEVLAEGERRFSEAEVDLLQMLAGQAGAAVMNTRLYRKVERQAITDGLTGLYNHRYFYDRLNQEFARAQRYGLPLSLLMLDVDDFKRFNDRYGHQVGDKILAETGRVLISQLRRGVDIAARYGGEEFVVLLPNTSADGAEVVGTRLVREVASLEASDVDLPPARLEGARSLGEQIRRRIAEVELTDVEASETTRLTVSVGLAAFPGAATNPDQLVRDADKALYLAKRLGKNRVEVFGA